MTGRSASLGAGPCDATSVMRVLLLDRGARGPSLSPTGSLPAVPAETPEDDLRLVHDETRRVRGRQARSRPHDGVDVRVRAFGEHLQHRQAGPRDTQPHRAELLLPGRLHHDPPNTAFLNESNQDTPRSGDGVLPQAKTIVFSPSTMTRSSTCQVTASASTWRST